MLDHYKNVLRTEGNNQYVFIALQKEDLFLYTRLSVQEIRHLQKHCLCFNGQWIKSTIIRSLDLHIYLLEFNF